MAHREQWGPMEEEQAMAEFKTLYSVDIDYRDVAKVINEYYEKRSKG